MTNPHRRPRQPLTYERLIEMLHYFPESGNWFWKPNRLVAGWEPAGTVSPQGYRKIQIAGEIYLSSRLAFLYMTGEWPGSQMDHIDGNPSNDRWDNLRPATPAQNMANKGVYKNNGLGVKGVRLHRNGRYEARLRVNRKLVYLGCYRTIEEAKAVYDKRAAEAFGEFARG